MDKYRCLECHAVINPKEVIVMKDQDGTGYACISCLGVCEKVEQFCDNCGRFNSELSECEDQRCRDAYHNWPVVT